MLLRTQSASVLHLPDQQPPARRNLSQWVFDALSHTLTEKPGITAVGAAPIVIAHQRKK